MKNLKSIKVYASDHRYLRGQNGTIQDNAKAAVSALRKQRLEAKRASVPPKI